MGNNQNQIIKQALEILSENNRFALKSITNDAAIKTNFYKLSGEPELRSELKEDLKKSDGPVVVFDNIKHVINNRFGVFSVKRDVAQLKKIINFIVINHQLINNQMKKNHLPKRNDFLKNLSKIISKD